MHRFVVGFALGDRESVQLDPSDGHHAAVVLRLKGGDQVFLLDGQGSVAAGRVTVPDRRRFEVAIEKVEYTPPRPYRLVLAAAILKGKAWDWVLQKAAELETSILVPLVLDRCVVRLESDGEGLERRCSDWQKTANEAAKQCGSPWITQIQKPQKLTDFLNGKSRWDVGLVASLFPGASEIRDVLGSASNPETVVMVVGPEGDFTPGEFSSAMEAGMVPVTLGRAVLRAETASIVALALAGHELQRRWKAG